jgi:hypothetical protein
MSIDLDDWHEEHLAALKAAAEFHRRSKKPNLPPDRWADGTIGMRLVAAGIGAQLEIIQMLSRSLADMQAAQMQAGADAMGVYDRHGRETS